MFSLSSARVLPWLKTPGTSIKRPTYQFPSRQYSSVNWCRMITLDGWIAVLSRHVDQHDDKQLNRPGQRSRAVGQERFPHRYTHLDAIGDRLDLVIGRLPP